MFLYSNGMVMDAFHMAREAHYGQGRKYTREPFIVHPVTVALKVMEVCDHPVVIAAALLHDVVEDTDITIDTIYREFGERVAKLVWAVTNKSTRDEFRDVVLTRRQKFDLNLEFLSLAPPDAQTIKYADMLDNVSGIVANDPKFAKVYVPEKIMVISKLRDGNPVLRAELEDYLALVALQI